MTYRLLVIACSERKKAGPEWLPAIDRYDGPVWQSVRAIYVPKNVVVMAMSARYGLFRSWLAIEMYNERMTLETTRQLVEGPDVYRPEWKATVNELRDAQEALRMRYGTRYAEPFGDMCLVGSPVYLAVMRHYVRGYAALLHYRLFSPDARLTEATGMIGRMRETMLDWICESPRISCSKLVDITAGNPEDTPNATRNRSHEPARTENNRPASPLPKPEYQERLHRKHVRDTGDAGLP